MQVRFIGTTGAEVHGNQHRRGLRYTGAACVNLEIERRSLLLCLTHRRIHLQSSEQAAMARVVCSTSSCQKILVFTLVTFFTTCSATLNLALNKPAYQSSTYQRRNASRAVDGNASGINRIRTCTRTAKSANPWWAVDLGCEHLVTHTQISNKIGHSYRLHDFKIGLTNTLPNATNGPQKSPYQVCLFYKGAFPATSKKLTCTNTARGRYLFIQIEGNSTSGDVLTLCEVEVYSYFEPSMMEMTGYRNNYNVSIITDANNDTCELVTTRESEKGFSLKIEMLTALDNLTMTAVLDNGDCLDFPATMVYTQGDQSAMLPYHNNPSFCDTEPGKCVFECDCSDTKCRQVFLVILSAPTMKRELCEIFIR
ncbi:hypothetical protein LSAT2_006992 [Lamellibrachia satsuma]|nr:hypothetical protein LSAT2_006992 [Lamellibrachia satsuma]